MSKNTTGFILLDELLRDKRKQEEKLFSGTSVRIPIITDKDVPPGMAYVMSGVEISEEGYLTTTIPMIPMSKSSIAAKYGLPPVPKHYAGIGSRETPVETQAFMRFLGWRLARENYILRSGGAEGADSAFEEGCDSVGGEKRIYLPWEGFNKRKAERGKVYATVNGGALKIAKEYHPAWGKLSTGGRLLHGRNVYQVLGHRCKTAPSLSEFVVCWTKGGHGRGGTGQALRIADAYGVRRWDLGSPDAKIIEIPGLSDYLGIDLLLEFEEWRS